MGIACRDITKWSEAMALLHVHSYCRKRSILIAHMLTTLMACWRSLSPRNPSPKLARSEWTSNRHWRRKPAQG